MPYSEMDNITLTKLALISQRARKEPKFQFTSLAHLLNEGFLKECYYKLGRDRASGIDGVSWEEYGENLDESVSNLVSRLKAKRYKPLPVKRAYSAEGDKPHIRGYLRSGFPGLLLWFSPEKKLPSGAQCCGQDSNEETHQLCD